MPPAKMSPVNELSRSQVMNNFASQGAHTSRITGVGFNPQLSTRFLEPDESRLISQRIENSRPKPKFIYKNTESSDEEENE